MACNPATPAPMTSTRDGVMVPAAVVSMGKMRGKLVGGDQHGLVAADGGHGGERVHALRAGDARHQLHRAEGLFRGRASGSFPSPKIHSYSYFAG
jgi:phage-related minor tail protein